MGLDMYLSAKKYLGNWNHNKDEGENSAHNAVLAAVGLAGFRCDSAPSLEVEVNVAYWRKANQIHKWFMDNGGEGYVEREKLEALVAACKQVIDAAETVDGDIHMGTTYHGDGRVEKHMKRGQVLAQKAIAEAILPTQSGFFFGSTDYDEYYLADLKDTVMKLRGILDNKSFDGWSFEYRASW